MRTRACKCITDLKKPKDDDSGDHDQNEENSTQKDGEKEKIMEDIQYEE